VTKVIEIYYAKDNGGNKQNNQEKRRSVKYYAVVEFLIIFIDLRVDLTDKIVAGKSKVKKCQRMYQINFEENK
jgi:hypothetical protein